MTWREVNFDGLVGLSHNYAGLSYGNVASAKNKGGVANPKEGALEGLEKMKFLQRLGLTQGVLPPHDRPHLSTLHALGYRGSDAEILTRAWADNPALVANVASASPMWTANAATVSPAPDTADGRTHFTAANLSSMFHRSIEAETTARILAAIFPEGERFAHHPPLSGGVHMGDEGAANHNRFCSEYGDAGLALYVYGRRAFGGHNDLTYPGRQTLEASQAVARQHGTEPRKTLFVRQNPLAINAGAFHNDVVAVSNKNVFFYHEQAFEDPPALRRDLQAAFGDTPLYFIEAPANKVPLEETVKSYLFNSQLVSPPNQNGMTLILPKEVEETPNARHYVDEMLASNGPIKRAHYLDVRQSMRNGGGPACLRLRVVMADADIAALGANVILTDDLAASLTAWVERHYRDRLMPEDLGDVALMEECFTALDELTQLLKLGNIYDFQR